MTVSLIGLGTAVPQFSLPQTLVHDTAKRILGPRYPQFERLSKTFETSGVENRYSVVPVDWFETEKGWPARAAAYLEGASALFVEAAQRALKDAGVAADQVDTVVTVSSTGIATPTLEAQVFDQMGFRPNVRRVPVFGLGCAGGVSGLSTARQLAEADPGSTVLMVAVETCSLAFRADRLQKADIIATVLFGDGAAAAVLKSEEGRVTVGQGTETLWSDTLSIMGWDIDDLGFGVVFDRAIPGFVEGHFAQAAAEALQRMNLSSVDRFVCHPGGAKVITAIEEAMALQEGTLDAERDTLRDYGNMSAPTVLFALKKVLDQGATGQLVMTALGPGFTGSFLPFKVAS